MIYINWAFQLFEVQLFVFVLEKKMVDVSILVLFLQVLEFVFKFVVAFIVEMFVLIVEEVFVVLLLDLVIKFVVFMFVKKIKYVLFKMKKLDVMLVEIKEEEV